MGFNLNSITRGVVISPPRMVVYGPHGIGKTTLFAEAPSPILLPTEDGKGKLPVASFPIAKTYSDVMSALGTLIEEEHEFNTLGIDSIDWLEPIIWAETCRRNNWNDIDTPGYGKGYTAADDVWREVFTTLSALRDRKGVMVMLLAHAKIKAFNDPSNEPYDRYSIKLQERASATTQEWADAVFFYNYKGYIQKADKGFNKTVARGVGVGERVLYTEERPSHLAKNRYGLAPEIPMPRGASWATLAANLFPVSQPA
jgi:hypothetical protein